MSNPRATPPPPGGGPNRKPPIRGHKKLNLLRDLAAGDLTYDELAVKYERHRTQIHNFAHTAANAAAIAQIRAAGMEALAGLWAADKTNRVAEYQDDVERFASSKDPALVRLRQSALRAVAEELGQLTTRIEGTHTVYEFRGVDPADLD